MEMKDKIRQLRIERGLTLEEVGNIVGVGKSTVRKWETGDIANMRRDKIAKLALALHTTPAYLLGCDEIERTAVPKDDGLSPLEAQLMEYIRRLTDDQKKMLLAQIELLLSKQGSRPDSRE